MTIRFTRACGVAIAAILAIALLAITCGDTFDDLPWDTYSDQADSFGSPSDAATLRTPDQTPSHTLGLTEPPFVLISQSHALAVHTRLATRFTRFLEVRAMAHAPPASCTDFRTPSQAAPSSDSLPALRI